MAAALVRGETMGEFKPAKNTIEEWHTDGRGLRSSTFRLNVSTF
jgi:hypothetical protein